MTTERGLHLVCVNQLSFGVLELGAILECHHHGTFLLLSLDSSLILLDSPSTIVTGSQDFALVGEEGVVPSLTIVDGRRIVVQLTVPGRISGFLRFLRWHMSGKPTP